MALKSSRLPSQYRALFSTFLTLANASMSSIPNQTTEALVNTTMVDLQKQTADPLDTSHTKELQDIVDRVTKLEVLSEEQKTLEKETIHEMLAAMKWDTSETQAGSASKSLASN
jgi:hypothetical protein